jgi:hypothetical protein
MAHPGQIHPSRSTLHSEQITQHMSNTTLSRTPFVAALLFVFAASLLAQTGGVLKRTTYKTQTFEAGSGMTVSVIGAPEGAVRIEGWNERDVEVSAEIEVRGSSEQDLDLLAKITGFAVDEGLTKISVMTVGPHDKKYLKQAAKDFPKRLRNSPFKINYTIKVPVYTDLIIDGGKGDLAIRGVEGAMSIKFLESNADLVFTGGSVQATIGSGDVVVTVAKPSWRGRFAEIQVASGKLDVKLPKDMNANIEAKILRTGQIEDGFGTLKPKRRTTFTETAMDAIAGNGGATMRFTVGDGTLSFSTIQKASVAEKE